MWGCELLASGRKFDTNIENKAVKITSELATKENGPAVTHDPRALNADSKPSIPFSSLGPATLKIGRHLWHKNATPTYIISVIFRISLLKVGMDRGCVNNGVCIIRAFQGVCSTCVRNNFSRAGQDSPLRHLPGLPFIISWTVRHSWAHAERAMSTRTFPWDHPKLEIISQ